jgi:hypothetical protein
MLLTPPPANRFRARAKRICGGDHKSATMTGPNFATKGNRYGCS